MTIDHARRVRSFVSLIVGLASALGLIFASSNPNPAVMADQRTTTTRHNHTTSTRWYSTTTMRDPRVCDCDVVWSATTTDKLVQLFFGTHYGVPGEFVVKSDVCFGLAGYSAYFDQNYAERSLAVSISTDLQFAFTGTVDVAQCRFESDVFPVSLSDFENTFVGATKGGLGPNEGTAEIAISKLRCNCDRICEYGSDGKPCDDGNPCTINDVCVQHGWCRGSGLLSCDDGDCSNGEEYCEPDEGCVNGTPPDCSALNEECVEGACLEPDVCAQVSRCGHPRSSASGKIVATDALYSLQAVTGAVECPLCVCDVDSSGAVVATDALVLLTAAIDESMSVDCPLP